MGNELKMSCWSKRDARTKIQVGCDSKTCVLHFSGTQTRNERVILDSAFLTFLISSLINPLGSTSTVDPRFVYFLPLPLSLVTLSNKPSSLPRPKQPPSSSLCPHIYHLRSFLLRTASMIFSRHRSNGNSLLLKNLFTASHSSQVESLPLWPSTKL